MARLVPVVLGLCLATLARADEERVVPAELQARLLLKSLTYERSRVADARVTVTVLVMPGQNASKALGQALAGSLREARVGDHPVEVEVVEWNPAQAREQFEGKRPTVLYVSAGLAEELPAIRALARTTQSLTVGAFERYEQAIGLSIQLKDDRPQLVVNLSVLKETGWSFSSDLLRLARVIR